VSWYQDVYLKSDHWKLIRAKALQYAGYACQLCDSERPPLNVHHRTYERLNKEEPADLTVLCEDCHKRFHGKLPAVPMAAPAPQTRVRRRPTPELNLLRVMVHHPEWRVRVVELVGNLAEVREPERTLMALLASSTAPALELLGSVEGDARLLLAEVLDEDWAGVNVDKTVEAETKTIHARVIVDDEDVVIQWPPKRVSRPGYDD
jgi:hypothetical protein